MDVISGNVSASAAMAAARSFSLRFSMRNRAGFFLNRRLTCVAECLDRVVGRRRWLGVAATVAAMGDEEGIARMATGAAALKMDMIGRVSDMVDLNWRLTEGWLVPFVSGLLGFNGDFRDGRGVRGVDGVWGVGAWWPAGDD